MTDLQFVKFYDKLNCLSKGLKNISEDIGSLPGGGGGGGGQNYNSKLDAIKTNLDDIKDNSNETINELKKITTAVNQSSQKSNEIKTSNDALKVKLEELIELHRETNTSLTTIGNGITEVRVKAKENTDAIVNKLGEVVDKLTQLLAKFP